jgi:transposase InsO family protein
MHQTFRHTSSRCAGVIVRSDNGLVFTPRKYRTLLTSYGLTQEFIHLHTPDVSRAQLCRVHYR